jgi:hypothetical protein
MQFGLFFCFQFFLATAEVSYPSETFEGAYSYEKDKMAIQQRHNFTFLFEGLARTSAALHDELAYIPGCYFHLSHQIRYQDARSILGFHAHYLLHTFVCFGILLHVTSTPH